MNRLVAASCLVAICLVALAGPGEPRPAAREPRLRRPIAAGFIDDGAVLCVANQRSGSVSLVDVAAGRVLAEIPVGERLADLALLPDRKHVLAVDAEKHELIALDWERGTLRLRRRLAVAPYPVSLAVLPGGTRATVAGLWSRRVQVIDLAGFRVLHTVELPFEPRGQCVLGVGARVLVADAFAGRLAIVDADAGRLLGLRELNGHNLRGLALDAGGRRLLAAHQILEPKAPATQENVARGVLLANVLRSLSVEALLREGADLEKAGETLRLGEPGNGAGDPAGVSVLDGGRVAVALAGVDEVALLSADGKPPRRVAVGRRPTALVREPGRPLVVLNTFGDSLSLLDADRGVVTATVSLGPQPALTFADRGELLFFDARLGRGRQLSCHSCHPDGHTTGLLADTLGDNTYGTPKRTLTLLNMRMTGPWGWNGEVRYTFDQVRRSLEQTMHAPTVTQQTVDDISSFLHTLPAPPPLEPATDDPADRARLERGRQVFERSRCGRCHIPPLTYTSHEMFDVGFADEKGLRKFNPPSLRGAARGRRLLHDNRADGLEEVFTKYRHKIAPDLPAEDLRDLLRFLRSL
jgi:YVTN family beta-propeller protein